MKQTVSLIIFSLISLITFGQDDPILFSVQDNQVRLSEFNYIYNKNNGDKADYSEESLQNYMDLYVKFKLKVERAKEMGLDTVTTLNNELAGYRKQLANSYLVDKEVANKLIEEVQNRMKTDRRVSHIFIPAEHKGNAEKITRAKEKISNIQRKLSLGQDFAELARTESEDKASGMKGGDLGYYTAPLPPGFYEFENQLYNTKLNGVSKTIRSKMGFHILKITDERPARGEMEVAHILLRKKKNGKLVENVKEQTQSVYDKLKGGADFDELAKTLSEDKNTAQNGGYLGFFGINQFEGSFEDAAFAIKSDGAYSQPIETKIGWHVIKRISKRDNSNPEEVQKRIKSKIAKSDRNEIAQIAMIEDIKTASGYKEDQQLLKQFVGKLGEDFYTYKWQVPQIVNGELVSFGDQKHQLSEFVEFAKKQTRERLRFNRAKPYKDAVSELFELFVKEKALAYEEATLEEKYPDFKALMREYKEGILLFEATKLEVWDKASQDTVGLNAFYESNKSNYKWKERAMLSTWKIKSSDSKLAKKIFKSAQKSSAEEVLKTYNENNVELVSVKEELLEAGHEDLANMKLKSGESSSMIYDDEKQITHFKTISKVMGASQKSLNEARGYIIADYQDNLEKDWIKQLREKYDVNIDDKVFKSLIK